MSSPRRLACHAACRLSVAAGCAAANRLPRPAAVGWRRRLVLMLLLGLALVAGGDRWGANNRLLAQEGGDPDPLLLVEKLGSPDYATRVRAQQDLMRVGLPAMDALQAALYHPDSEIAAAARYLIDSLMGDWWLEEDEPVVRELLTNYGELTDAEKRARIEHLAAERPSVSGFALARLARYEPNETLSRHAALAVLRGELTYTQALDRQSFAQRLLTTIGASERMGPRWLAAYAADLQENSVGGERWAPLFQAQRQSIQSAADPDAESELLLDLVRMCAQRAAAAGQPRVAQSLIRDHLDLIAPSTRGLLQAVRWIIDIEQYPLVLELQQRYPTLFAEHPVLLYGAAEAALRGDMAAADGVAAAGDGVAGEPVVPSEAARAAAEQLAAAALAIDPLPTADAGEEGDAEAGAPPRSPRSVEDAAMRHRETGRDLESRGLFQWAQREYQQIIDAMPADSVGAAAARVSLARMFADREQHEQVVDVLQPLVQRSEADQAYARRLQGHMVNVAQLKSTLLYHRAQHEAANDPSQNSDQVKQWYTDALQLDPANVDILIAMYHYEGDVFWRTEVRNKLREMTLMLERQVERYRMIAPERRLGADNTRRLSEAYNQYAWLVANTEGNKQNALSHSLESLRLTPDEPANLDTAARCYFALGQYADAVRMQERALKLSPHSPPLQRQLQEFRAAADSSGQ